MLQKPVNVFYVNQMYKSLYTCGSNKFHTISRQGQEGVRENDDDKRGKMGNGKAGGREEGCELGDNVLFQMIYTPTIQFDEADNRAKNASSFSTGTV